MYSKPFQIEGSLKISAVNSLNLPDSSSFYLTQPGLYYVQFAGLGKQQSMSNEKYLEPGVFVLGDSRPVRGPKIVLGYCILSERLQRRFDYSGKWKYFKHLNT